MRTRHACRAMPALTFLIVGAASFPAHAQQADWNGKVQVNGSLFFGATDQRVIGTDGELTRADSAWEVGMTAAFRYGESSDGTVRTVQARSWLGGLSVDARPHATWSPFAFGNIGSSYEQRLALRASGGAGMKWTPVRTATTKASLSAAVLAEHTRSLASLAGLVEDASVGRWSLRANFNRRNDRASFTHVTSYQPRITRMGDVLVTTVTQFAYTLSGAITATVSITDTYDSVARERGARSNTDGQLLVGLALGK